MFAIGRRKLETTQVFKASVLVERLHLDLPTTAPSGVTGEDLALHREDLALHREYLALHREDLALHSIPEAITSLSTMVVLKIESPIS